MKLALFGYGGHAREVAAQINKEVTFFVDDEYVNEHTKPISSFDPSEYLLMVAIADCQERKRVVERLPKETNYFIFVHPTAQILAEDVDLGEGTFVGANSIITTNITIGKHGILNRGNHIGHDTIIGDFFSAMPSAIISGNVKIGNQVYFGTNSCIRQNLTVCDDVLVGLNSGVVKSITKPGIYVGTPAKKIK